MYEYIKTATGWVLCWGGVALYPEVGAETAAEEPAPVKLAASRLVLPASTLDASDCVPIGSSTC